MTRVNWSNFFLFLAAVNLALGTLPSNNIKLVDWIAVPCFLVAGAAARRRMI